MRNEVCQVGAFPQIRTLVRRNGMRVAGLVCGRSPAGGLTGALLAMLTACGAMHCHSTSRQQSPPSVEQLPTDVRPPVDQTSTPPPSVLGEASFQGGFGTGRILFVRRNALTKDWSHGGDLWIFDAATGETAQLTSGGDHQSPRWSYDGLNVVYEALADRASVSRLFVVRADGTGVRALTGQERIIESWPAWSPNGRSIAFAAHSRGTGRYALFRIASDGSRPARLSAPRNQDDAMPVWSRNGREIFFVSYRNSPNPETGKLYVMSATGEPARRMTSLPAEVGETDPRVSPDGRLLAFRTYRYDPSRHAIDPSNSYILTLATGALSDLNAVLGEVPSSPGLVPFWSPDMTRMALVTAQGMLVTDVRGGGRQLLASELDVHGDLAWSPDGRQLAFRAGWLVGRDLYVIDTVRRRMVRLTASGDVDGHMSGLEWHPASGPMPVPRQRALLTVVEPASTARHQPPPPRETLKKRVDVRECRADSECTPVEVKISVSCAGAPSCGWHAVRRGESVWSGCPGGPYPGHPCSRPPPGMPPPTRAACERGRCVVVGARTGP